MILDILGGGVVVVVVYVIVSNLFWLLVGSAFIQRLPGVDIKGVRGTVQIACMAVCVVSAALIYLCFHLLYIFKVRSARLGYNNLLATCLSRVGSRLPF